MRLITLKNFIGATLFLIVLFFITASIDLAAGSPTFASSGCLNRTIHTVDDTVNVQGQVSLAIGSDGFPVIAYYDATNQDLKVAHCGDVACGTAVLQTIDSTGDVGLWNSITIGTDGFPIIAYHDRTNFDLKVAHCGDVACTPALAKIQTLDSNGSLGRYPSIKIGRDGFPVISYHDLDNFNLKVAHCGDAVCTPALAVSHTPDSFGYVGVDTSLAIGSDGFPVIAHYEGSSQDLKVTHCGDASCTSALAISYTLDSVGDVGRNNSIGIGGDGFPVISYFDYTNSDLKVAKCGDVVCNPVLVSLKTLDSTDDVGHSTSLAIGTDNLPIISYYYHTSKDLKLAKCDDAGCTPALVRKWVPDSSGDVGVDTSLAISTDGFPVIAYTDSTDPAHGSLKVVKCTPWRLFHPVLRRD